MGNDDLLSTYQVIILKIVFCAVLTTGLSRVVGRKESYRVGCFASFITAVILAFLHSVDTAPGTLTYNTAEGVSGNDETGRKSPHILWCRNLEKSVS